MSELAVRERPACSARERARVTAAQSVIVLQILVDS